MREFTAVQVPSGPRRQKLTCELRTVAATPQYLGFEAFKSFAEAQSFVLTEDVYSSVFVPMSQGS
jgi:hypothetical protein